MKNTFALLFLFAVIFSCSENKSTDNELTEKENNKKQTLEEIIDRHVQSQLSIPSTEKYTLHIYKEHLDGDDKIDAIITVNRLNFAYEEANKSGKYEIRKELGFTGHYNYIFYFDGGLDLISPPIAIPSSPLLPLKVSFENVSSSDFQDIIVDFRIRNASYRDYYFVKNHTPARVFQWKNFDGLGTSDAIAFTFSYQPGKVNAAKNIVIHKAKIGAIPEGADLNTFVPEITKTNNLERMFFYLPSQGKYLTESK